MSTLHRYVKIVVGLAVIAQFPMAIGAFIALCLGGGQ